VFAQQDDSPLKFRQVTYQEVFESLCRAADADVDYLEFLSAAFGSYACSFGIRAFVVTERIAFDLALVKEICEKLLSPLHQTKKIQMSKS
jgi:hypothetical protein